MQWMPVLARSPGRLELAPPAVRSCCRRPSAERRGQADFAIDNSGSFEETERRVATPVAQLLGSPGRRG
jgi:dephospho-CoA kinase